MDAFKRFAIHPILFSLYPTLALLAHNIREVEVEVAIRPLLISCITASIMLCVARLIFKDWIRASLLTTFTLVLFFSYGHVYQVLRDIPVIGLSVARHRYLAFIYAGGFILGLWWIDKRVDDVHSLNLKMNLIALFLLAFPLFKISSFSLKVYTGERAVSDLLAEAFPLDIAEGMDLPDVYYIILDTYTRADALLDEFDFNNSPFLGQLREKDFYIAECSRANYSNTETSLTSSLNMNYLFELGPILDASGLDQSDFWLLLKQTLVRSQLEGLGYKTIAFETGYQWSQWTDADLYLGTSYDPVLMQLIKPFEAMLIKSTAGLILTDFQYESYTERKRSVFEPIYRINFPYRDFAKLQLFILDNLPTLASIPYPKFVFAHLLVPHVPRIFAPNGEILSDPGYYGGGLSGPINDEYDVKGYRSEVQFINGRVLEIVDAIIEGSTSPPIIIIQGDTGTIHHPFKILNAYYLRGDENPKLYPSISPVNSFRVIFDTYFETSYGLLPDYSLHSGDFSDAIQETSAECLQD